MDLEERSFTVVEVRKTGQKNKSGSLKKTKSTSGRFISKTPDGAARKAFSQHCRMKDIRGQCTLTVTLQETTRGSAGKIYKYALKRIKLAQPKMLNRGGTLVKIEYDTVIKSLN